MPVVFHVVYNGNDPLDSAAQNVPDSFLLQALQEMNRDFRKLNPDWVNTPAVWQPLVADCQIEFCLAVQDPNGNPTSGITHTTTTEAFFSPPEFVMWSGFGGEDAWDPSRYFNIWTCKLFSPLYAYKSIRPWEAFGVFDGAVVDYRIAKKMIPTPGAWYQHKMFSSAAAGYLNLWGIEGDCAPAPPCSDCDTVPDTPNTQYGFLNMCTNTDSCTPGGPMSMNFMTSAVDSCRYMFTLGQKARMRAALLGPRASLLSSTVCSPVGVNENYSQFNFLISPNPSSGKFTINAKGEVSIYNLLGEKVYSQKTDASRSLSMTVDLSSQPKGVYFVHLSTENGTVTKKLVIH
ncbi:MAG: zinc-dependent metalloprotease [Candidatus Babeliales bacterium]